MNLRHFIRNEAKHRKVESSISLFRRQSGFLFGKTVILLGIISFCVVCAVWYLASSPKRTSLELETLKEIDALVAEMHKKNVQAKGRALRSLRDQFAVYRRGIPAFSEDINSLGTRLQILALLIGEKIDTWFPGTIGLQKEALVRGLVANPKKVSVLQEFVGEKFRRHVVSEDKLKAAIKDAIAQYQIDLAANRNECLRKASTASFPSEGAAVAKVRDNRLAFLQGQTRHRIEELSRGLGEKSLSVEIATATGGYVLEPTLTVFFARITRSLVTSLAALALGPGAAAELAALFGSGGTLAGPAGTAIGFGVGCAIGYVIDSALTEDIKAKLGESVGLLLSTVERDVLEGPIKLPQDKQKGGLRDIFDESGSLTEEAVRQTLKSAYQEEKR